MSYLRKNIDAMAGYSPGEQPAPGGSVVKLNTNENPYPPSPRVVAALPAVAAGRLRRYPDPMANKVRDILARMHGVGRDSILCGNGSDELLTLVVRALVGQRQRIAWPTPTYSLYPVLAEIQGATAVEIPTLEDFSLPVETLERVKARAMILCNPNAPTGVFAPVDSVERIAERFGGVVIVDEAYVDFSADNAMRLASSRPNVIVLRTLSKSYSLAGLRFGYAVGPAPLIAGLEKVKDSYNVDAVSIELAAAALEDQAWMRANVEKVRSERVRLASRLAALGFDVTPSEANFILARVPLTRVPLAACSQCREPAALADKPPAVRPRHACRARVAPMDGMFSDTASTNNPGDDGQAWYERLKERGILVRWWNLPRLADKLRITVGTPGENDALLAAISDMQATGTGAPRG